MQAMRAERYTPAHQPVWDAHVAMARNGHFMHRRAYMDYHADRFTDHSLLFFNERDELRALLPANADDATLYSHQGLSFGGLILHPDTRAAEVLATMDALRHYAHAQGFATLIYKAMPAIYHQAAACDDEYALFRAGAELYRVDISTSIVRAHALPFSSLRKRGAKKAQKEGISVRESRDFAAYHAILRRIVEGKYDAQVTHNEAEMMLLAERFPQHIRLHGAYRGEDMLAGVLMFATPTVAHAQYIGASDEGREAGALDLLFTQLIEQDYRDHPIFDFGISTEQGGRVLNTGLIHQKEGFGGRGTLHRFYRLPLSNTSPA